MRLDENLLSAPQTFKDYISQYKQKKEIFGLKERHDNTNIESPNKNFFTNNLIVDIFVFTTANNIGYSYNNNTIFAVQTQ